jgi:hypothetical protein
LFVLFCPSFLTIWYLSHFLGGWNMFFLWGFFCFGAYRQKDPEKLVLLLISVLFVLPFFGWLPTLCSAFIRTSRLVSFSLSFFISLGLLPCIYLNETTVYKFRLLSFLDLLFVN